MSSPLQRLLQGSGVAVTADTLESFLAEGGPAVLLFTGDPVQRPEAQDIAVVAGQLVKQVHGLRVGVVISAAADPVKLRFGVTVVPTVVFVDGGEVKSTIAKLQDWSIYAQSAGQAFGALEEPRP